MTGFWGLLDPMVSAIPPQTATTFRMSRFWYMVLPTHQAVAPDNNETETIGFAHPEDVEDARLVAPERRTFAQWRAFQKTGSFQMM